jgi:hypothetical protein
MTTRPIRLAPLQAAEPTETISALAAAIVRYELETAPDREPDDEPTVVEVRR